MTTRVGDFFIVKNYRFVGGSLFIYELGGGSFGWLLSFRSWRFGRSFFSGLGCFRCRCFRSGFRWSFSLRFGLGWFFNRLGFGDNEF